jgi:hypothetical protein
VFEWGAGFSSLWFAKHVKEVISIEENVAWYRELKPQLPSNVALMCLPARDDYVRAIRTTTGDLPPQMTIHVLPSKRPPRPPNATLPAPVVSRMLLAEPIASRGPVEG